MSSPDALSPEQPTMQCPHGCIRCTTCESSAAAKELAALRKVAAAALAVYQAWDRDLPHTNKMFTVGRELRDAGYELVPVHRVGTEGDRNA